MCHTMRALYTSIASLTRQLNQCPSAVFFFWERNPEDPNDYMHYSPPKNFKNEMLVAGIEPASTRPQRDVLPLYYTSLPYLEILQLKYAL